MIDGTTFARNHLKYAKIDIIAEILTAFWGFDPQDDGIGIARNLIKYRNDPHVLMKMKK